MLILASFVRFQIKVCRDHPFVLYIMYVQYFTFKLLLWLLIKFEILVGPSIKKMNDHIYL